MFPRRAAPEINPASTNPLHTVYACGARVAKARPGSRPRSARPRGNRGGERFESAFGGQRPRAELSDLSQLGSSDRAGLRGLEGALL